MLCANPILVLFSFTFSLTYIPRLIGDRALRINNQSFIIYARCRNSIKTLNLHLGECIVLYLELSGSKTFRNSGGHFSCVPLRFSTGFSFEQNGVEIKLRFLLQLFE